MMKYIQYFSKFFLEDSYSIAYRRIADSEPIPPHQGTSYSLIPHTQFAWWADPFVLEHNGQVYIFVELYRRFHGKGTIAYFKIQDNGKASHIKEVIKEPFHMSFPNLFKFKDDVYMIPETGKSGQIRLYRAINFPDQWVLDKVLFNGGDIVDTAFIFDNGIPKYAIAMDFESKAFHFFMVDLERKELLKLPNNKMLFKERNGGNCLQEGDIFIRVLQDCSNDYGERILFYKFTTPIDDLCKGTIRDEYSSQFSIKELSKATRKNYTRVHTFNRSQHYEVIDLFSNGIILLKPIRKTYSIIKKIFKVLFK